MLDSLAPLEAESTKWETQWNSWRVHLSDLRDDGPTTMGSLMKSDKYGIVGSVQSKLRNSTFHRTHVLSTADDIVIHNNSRDQLNSQALSSVHGKWLKF